MGKKIDEGKPARWSFIDASIEALRKQREALKSSPAPAAPVEKPKIDNLIEAEPDINKKFR